MHERVHFLRASETGILNSLIYPSLGIRVVKSKVELLRGEILWDEELFIQRITIFPLLLGPGISFSQVLVEFFMICILVCGAFNTGA